MSLEYKGDISNNLSAKYQDDMRQATFNDLEWKQIDLTASLNAFQEHIFELKQDMEYVLDCEEQLIKEIFALIMLHGTEQQTAVALGILHGKTQTEIAAQLEMGQPEVHKCLQGNIDYTYNPPRRNGGLKKKLIKEIKQSNSCKNLMKEMFITGTMGIKTPYYTTILTNVFENGLEFKKWIGVL